MICTGVHITLRLDLLPVYVRAGSVLPPASLVESTDEMARGAHTLPIYTGEPCTGLLCLDDGKSYAFQLHANSRMSSVARLSHLGISGWKSFVPVWNRADRDVKSDPPGIPAVFSNCPRRKFPVDANAARVGLLGKGSQAENNLTNLLIRRNSQVHIGA